MARFRSFLRSWSNLFLLIGVASQLAMGSMTFLNVICRSLGIAMAGYTELVEVLMIAVGISALAISAFEKTQVAIDVVVNLFSEEHQIIFQVFASVVNLLFWGAMLVVATDFVFGDSLHERTDILNIPVFPFYLFWVLGLVLLFLVFVLDTLETVCKRRKQE
jgi:TRAP-type C4-dicarboxylate transport system permease small subunit